MWFAFTFSIIGLLQLTIFPNRYRNYQGGGVAFDFRRSWTQCQYYPCNRAAAKSRDVVVVVVVVAFGCETHEGLFRSRLSALFDTRLIFDFDHFGWVVDEWDQASGIAFVWVKIFVLYQRVTRKRFLIRCRITLRLFKNGVAFWIKFVKHCN